MKRRGLSSRTQENAFHLEKREKTKEQSEGRVGTFQKHLRTCPNVAEDYKDEKLLSELTLFHKQLLKYR